MPTLRYETPGDSIETLTRDEFHADKPGFIVGYNNPTHAPGVEDKVQIPTKRVVRIDD